MTFSKLQIILGIAQIIFTLLAPVIWMVFVYNADRRYVTKQELDQHCGKHMNREEQFNAFVTKQDHTKDINHMTKEMAREFAHTNAVLNEVKEDIKGVFRMFIDEKK